LNAIRRLINLILRQRAMAGAMATLIIKASGAILMIVVFTLAARSMSTTAFGELAMWFNALSCLAVAAVFGQETLIGRSWGEYAAQKRPDLMIGAYRFGWTMVTICAAIACCGLLVASCVLPVRLSALALFAACAFVAAQTLLHYSSHSSRMIVGYLVSEPHRELTWRILLLAVVALHLHGSLTLETFFVAAAVGMTLAMAAQLFFTLKNFPVKAKSIRPTYLRREWLGRAFGMFLTATVEGLSQYAEVIVLGFLATPSAAAGYFIAARIANIFPMLSSGLNTYMVTSASHLHFGGKVDRLQNVLRSVMTMAFFLAAPIYIVLALAAGPILSIFGAFYALDRSALIVLATASFIVTLSGPSSALLLITGDEKLWSRIAFFSLALRIALMSRLAPEYGAVGAAASWAMVNIPVAMAASILCRRRCGVDPSALTLLSFFRRGQALKRVDQISAR
jgi:O-antigen/teichoic acid export membrane protein